MHSMTRSRLTDRSGARILHAVASRRFNHLLAGWVAPSFPRLGRHPRSFSSLHLDVERARQDTRGCNSGFVFLNSAGSSLPPRGVVDAHLSYLREEEKHGGYFVADKFSAELESFYPAASKLLNCTESEVAFVESATRGWTLLFHSMRFSPGDRIITSASDYGSNFVGYLQAKERFGAVVVIVPDDETGQINLDTLRAEVADPRARLISINHVPTCGGLIQPVEQIGQIACDFGVPFLLDACQSVGQMEVDARAIKCDMLTATGRKFLRGPRGTGLMYVRQDFMSKLDPCMLDQEGALVQSETKIKLRGDARCFEQYEYNFAGKVGLAQAIEYASGMGLREIEARVAHLSSRLRKALAAIDRVNITDVGRRLCGIVTFEVEGIAAEEVRSKLRARGIDVSVSAAAGGGPRVWFDRRGLTAVIRASPHYFNTVEEVDELAAAVADISHHADVI